MQKLTYAKTIVLGFLVYFFSYSMRLDYSATLVALTEDLHITNTAASAAITGSFITYGIGQVLCGFIGDKISPVKMISLAMLGTILVNALVSVNSNIWLITLLWCCNGVFQAMVWPPLTRFVAEQVGVEKYSDAITMVGLSASIGTIFVYLVVPGILSLTVWRNVFRCMAIFGLIIMVVWICMTKGVSASTGRSAKPDRAEKAAPEKSLSVFAVIALAGLVPIFTVIIFQGLLRDGIQTWLPSLVSEQFHLGASASVLSTVVLPVLSMVSVIVSNMIYHRLRNEVATAALFYAVAFVASVPMALGVKMPVLLTVVLASLISGSMHGVNHMLICIIPKHFAKFGMVSTFSGVLNAFTYIGASVSSYGFAFLADSCGWSMVFISWFVIALAALLLCVFKIKKWKAFIEQ